MDTVHGRTTDLLVRSNLDDPAGGDGDCGVGLVGRAHGADQPVDEHDAGGHEVFLTGPVEPRRTNRVGRWRTTGGPSRSPVSRSSMRFAASPQISWVRCATLVIAAAVK